MKKDYSEISKFLENYFINRKYFACIYGSYVTINNNKSDLDLFVAVENYNDDDIRNVKNFLIEFHKKNDLKIDNEVPYENKLLISYREVERAIFLTGFDLVNNRFVVPQVIKSYAFLSSIEIRRRLILNALTSPHIYLGSDLIAYSLYKEIAEYNIVLLSIDILNQSAFKERDILGKLMQGEHGEENEFYLGYYDHKCVKNYLISNIKKQITKNLLSGRLIKTSQTFKIINGEFIDEVKKSFKELKNHKIDKIFIGVAWPYVNGDLHVGHIAGYLLPADICARFNRIIGNDVLMVSGSDCFGTPITMEADKRRMTPRQIVSEYHAKNIELFKILGISYDLYTKTDTDNHKKLVQDFFVELIKKELIFCDESNQYYSPEENRFLPDRYVEGTCPNCGYKDARSDQCDRCGKVLNQGELINPRAKNSGKSVELKSTEHYFLDWPKLEDFFRGYVSSRGGTWKPWILKETLNWLNQGLKARAITRDLDWGVEIPLDRLPEEMRIGNADKKRIYVWFEAVIGYLSASIEWSLKNNDEKWKDFWHNPQARHYYFMGKDNLVFHTLFWPGQLHGYDQSLHLPDFPIINQFLNLEGQKFSKSHGITIDSRYIIEAYGVDPIRFYLCSIMPENADSNFGWSDFVDKNNNILIGNLGNFINRSLTLSKDIEFGSSNKVDKNVDSQVEKSLEAARKYLEKCEFKKYLETILTLSSFGNKYISTNQPWEVKKTDFEKFKEIMFNNIFISVALTVLIGPLMPKTSNSLKMMLNIEISSWPNGKDVLKFLTRRVNIKNISPLFSKIDENVVESESRKLNLS